VLITNRYEALIDEAHNEGLMVKEKPLESSNGRIKGNRIAIRRDIETSTEKACVLAEELGHHHTGVGNIVYISSLVDEKQEWQARIRGYNQMIGLHGLINAFEHGCQGRTETAEYLEVTEEYLQDCVDCYQEKYGVGTIVDNYYIMFIPCLSVGKLI